MHGVVISLFLLALAGPALAATDAEYDACEKGREPQAMIAACSKLLQDRKETVHNRAAIHVARGRAYFRERDYDRAIADYDAAIKLYPGYSRAMWNRGDAHQAKRNYDRAIRDYNEALKLNPGNAPVYVSRGNAYRAKGDLDRAITDYSEAIERFPIAGALYSVRGNAYQQKGDLDAAIADFTKAIEVARALRLEASDASHFFYRAQAYRAKGEIDAAIADFRQALQLRPDLDAAREALRALGVSP